MPGHCANIGEKDTLFKDRETPQTIPYSAERTYIAHIGEYPPPPGGLTWNITQNPNPDPEDFRAFNDFAQNHLSNFYLFIVMA